MTQEDSALAHLPTHFTLTISQRDGWWVISSPEQPGFYLLHRDLAVILADVPLVLSTLRRLNGAPARQAND